MYRARAGGAWPREGAVRAFARRTMPASLRQLREAVLPRVDLPEALLEVFSWTGADQAFTSVTGGEARLKDLHVTIAALLVAHSCNVGYTPVIGAADALEYGRLSHVDQTHLRLATYRAANATLIDYQAAIPLAQAWGGGMRPLRDPDAAEEREPGAGGIHPSACGRSSHRRSDWPPQPCVDLA